MSTIIGREKAQEINIFFSSHLSSQQYCYEHDRKSYLQTLTGKKERPISSEPFNVNENHDIAITISSCRADPVLD